MAYCKRCDKEVETIRSWCGECGHNITNVDRLFINYEIHNKSSSKSRGSKKPDPRLFDFLSVVGNQFF